MTDNIVPLTGREIRAQQLIIQQMQRRGIPRDTAVAMTGIAAFAASRAVTGIGQYLDLQCDGAPPPLLSIAAVALLREELRRVEGDIERQLAESGHDASEVRTAFDLGTLRQARHPPAIARA